jgi:hypothetical protein
MIGTAKQRILRAMRRALVLISVLAAALLGTASTVAAAGERPLLKPEFELRADGFLVQLKTEPDSSRVFLSLGRHGLIAYYDTAARITEDSITAHFGRLGDLEYTFTPTPGGSPHCAGRAAAPEGTFRGSFDFTGENGYVQIEADHARGSFASFPAAACEKAQALRRRKPAKDVTLTASVGNKQRGEYLLAFTLQSKRGPRLFINGFRAERREGMQIERGAQLITGPGALRWDSRLETAHLDPPAPFRGSADFSQRPGKKPSWTGSLRTPLLGGGTLHLAGGRFKVELGHGSLID